MLGTHIQNLDLNQKFCNTILTVKSGNQTKGFADNIFYCNGPKLFILQTFSPATSAMIGLQRTSALVLHTL